MRTPDSAYWLYTPNGVKMWNEGCYALVLPLPGTLAQRVIDEDEGGFEIGTSLKAFRLHGDNIQSIEYVAEDIKDKPHEEEAIDAWEELGPALLKLPLVSSKEEGEYFTKRVRHVSEIASLTKARGLEGVIQLAGRTEKNELAFPRYNETLFDYVDRHRGKDELSNKRRHEILSQVALAMDRLHRVGVVHKDLHPGNLLVSDTGAVVIADLECAAVSVQLIPPEYHLASGDYVYTTQADVYAFSKLIFSVVQNNTPRPFKTLEIDEPFRQLYEECAAYDPKDRPSMAEVARKLKLLEPDVGQ